MMRFIKFIIDSIKQNKTRCPAHINVRASFPTYRCEREVGHYLDEESNKSEHRAVVYVTLQTPGTGSTIRPIKVWWNSEGDISYVDS